MRYHIDSLHICYGIQITDPRGDIGVIYAQGLMHVFIIFSPIETLGSPCSSLCGLSITNMNMLWCYSSTNSRIDRTEKNSFALFQYELFNRSSRKYSFEVVSCPTNNSYLQFSANRNSGVIVYCTLRDNHMIQLCQHC